MKAKLFGIPLRVNRRDDKLIWSLIDHGKFTMKSAYFSAFGVKRDNKGLTSSNFCSTQIELWGLSIPENMKSFLWRLNTNSLPSKSNLYSRQITSDLACPICLQEEETKIHMMWSYSATNDIWVATTLSTHKWPKIMGSFTQLWDKVRVLEKPDIERATIIMRHL